MTDYLDTLKSRLDLGLFKKVPVIRQDEAAECGLVCLAMISQYYGLNVDTVNLRNVFRISSKGLTLAALTKIAGYLGFNYRPLSLELEELSQLKTPSILHWDMNHFVVLTKVKANHIVINDPTRGELKIPFKEVSKHFTGVALEMWPGTEFKPGEQRSALRLMDLLKNVKGLSDFLLKIFSFALVIELINVLIPIGTQLVMDHVLVASDKDLLSIICIGLIMTVILRTVMSSCRAWLTLILNTFINVQWSAGLFSHLLKLPIEFFEKRKLGDIQSRFDSLDTVRSTVTSSLVNTILDAIMVVTVLVMMVLYGGWLVWVVLGFTLFYLALRLLTYKYYRQLSEESIIRKAEAKSHFMESLYGITTLKVLGINEKRAVSWMNLNVNAVNADIKLSKADMFFGGINTLISSLEQIIILWLGALAIINGNMTVGMFVAFSAYRSQFSERTANLINTAIRLKMLGLHTQRISDIALTKTEKLKPWYALFPSGEAVSVAAENVTFRYDDLSPPVLQEISFTVQPGESVAIIGPSGAGKSTLIKILSGLIVPTSGAVLVNNIDINKAGVNNYRDIIACVLQEDRLFAGSIMDNIAGYDTEIDRERIIACATFCAIHNEITVMPMGYDTMVGELGSNLSGGQKQRILLARALYRKPRILFLDESTSHLDEGNEAWVNAAISKLKITRILVAHRRSTILSADRIYDLKQKRFIDPTEVAVVKS